MFSKVLVGMDFSDCSLKAVKYAKKLKEAGTKEVIFVSVIENISLEEAMEICEYKKGDYEQCLENVQEKMKADIEKKLEKIGKDFDIPYKIEVRIGKPFVQILDAAEEYDVNLIVLGSHGKGVVTELMVGSVSENVIRHTNMPVLIVR